MKSARAMLGLFVLVAGCGSTAADIGPAPPIQTTCIISANRPAEGTPPAPPGAIYAPPQGATGIRLQPVTTKAGLIVFDRVDWPAPQRTGVACVQALTPHVAPATTLPEGSSAIAP